MKVDFGKKITNLDGEIIKDENGKEIQLKGLCINVLCMIAEENVTGQEKFKRFEMAEKISQSKGELEIPAEDVALIKKLIGKAYIPLMVGKAYRILEGV